jgi:hypothetical protein
VFGQALWKPRKVGSIETVPFPSIVGKKIGEVFFHKNRLGLAAQGRVIMSQNGDSLNLFLRTATDLLPDDAIDVESIHLADFHSALLFNEEMLLWSSDAQTVLTPDSKQPLTPESIGLDRKTEFTNSTRLRPVADGNKLYFCRGKDGSVRVYEYGIVDQTGKASADDITQNQPTYIQGNPVAMVFDSGFGALLTDADQSKLYVYCSAFASQTRVQNAWSRWEFAPGTRIVALDIIDGKLGLIVSRPQGVYLEIINLDPSAV